MRMLWSTLAVALIATCVSACGTGSSSESASATGPATETFKSTDAATTLTCYLVISSDSQASLGLINESIVGGQTATISLGDVHVGTRLCTTTLEHEGHTYSVAYYVSGTIPSSVIGGGSLQAQLPAACETLLVESKANNSVVWNR